jgi:hypothetical protein
MVTVHRRVAGEVKTAVGLKKNISYGYGTGENAAVNGSTVARFNVHHYSDIETEK